MLAPDLTVGAAKRLGLYISLPHVLADRTADIDTEQLSAGIDGNEVSRSTSLSPYVYPTGTALPLK